MRFSKSKWWSVAVPVCRFLLWVVQHGNDESRYPLSWRPRNDYRTSIPLGGCWKRICWSGIHFKKGGSDWPSMTLQENVPKARQKRVRPRSGSNVILSSPAAKRQKREKEKAVSRLYSSELLRKNGDSTLVFGSPGVSWVDCSDKGARFFLRHLKVILGMISISLRGPALAGYSVNVAPHPFRLLRAVTSWYSAYFGLVSVCITRCGN